MSTSPTPSHTTSAHGARRTAAPNAQRRAAKRRAAFGQRMRRFETVMPGLRTFSAGSARSPAIPISAIGFTGFVWSKVVSLLLLGGVLFSVVWLNADSRWYVYPEQVQVTGQRLLGVPALANDAGVSGWNIFWLERSTVRDRILQNPWVTAANVAFALPATVRVQVTEAPAIGVWSTEQGDYWISPTGAALPMAQPAPSTMPRLVDPTMAATRPGSSPGTAVDTNIVASALALMANVSGVSEVRYSAEIGLHFGLPGTALYVHWGDGEHVAEKLEMLRLGRQLEATGEFEGSILDVRFPDVVTTR